MSFFVVKQKMAYELRISDWSSDVCSSDLVEHFVAQADAVGGEHRAQLVRAQAQVVDGVAPGQLADAAARGEAEGVGMEQLAVVGVGLEHHLVDARVLLRIPGQAHVHARLEQGAEGLRQHGRQAARSEEHTSELQSLM